MINKIKLQKSVRKLLADTYTPVNLYLKLRDNFPQSALLESADFKSAENSNSFLCFNPMAELCIEGLHLTFKADFTNEEIDQEFTNKEELTKALQNIIDNIDCSGGEEGFNNGFFGYFSFESLALFEDINLEYAIKDKDVPDVKLIMYKNVIRINHFTNVAKIYCFSNDADNLSEIEDLISMTVFPKFSFSTVGEREASCSESEYLKLVSKAKEHCQLGDVFQLVLSRRFTQKYKGDEFNAYRALRSINPSPYLFYFDFGDFKVFGSSPESQLVINNKELEIDPIAGTVKRSGDDAQDAKMAKLLVEDAKENAEHNMLVDLARNDLSRVANEVEVSRLKEVHYYSHVIHLVSKVKGVLKDNVSATDAFGATFPAGTLSGAPKYKAIELIHHYEQMYRGIYGGAIGFVGSGNELNLAITIRSFLAKDGELKYQAGAGIVAKSQEESELQEVYNKVAALEAALELANNI